MAHTLVSKYFLNNNRFAFPILIQSKRAAF